MIPERSRQIRVSASLSCASLSRAHARNQRKAASETRMDEQSLDFHRKVYEAYQALAAREPGRIKRVDGRRTIDQVENAVWEIVSAYV